jgi:hypothetical protein
MSDRPMTPATSTWNLPSRQAVVPSGTTDWATVKPAIAELKAKAQTILRKGFFIGNLDCLDADSAKL